ncbi:hypothetical protein, partial [Pseudomonas fluorescens]|uniref:hypothetical protein n=1 Tax=Pseudomonas fluorescens TaxID=294 RepID=UPI001C83DFE4
NNQRKIAPSTLKDFQQRYVFNREIAHQFLNSPKRISSQLIDSGFQPVAGPHAEGSVCRHYLWRRDEELYDFLTTEFRNRFVGV